ncbi:uncharacterized protein [Mytilus edulis]|uniref:uncharacterized protein n=1 Tax=Mytilus edulis TaxID=6550 RepID=UPI0039F05DC7
MGSPAYIELEKVICGRMLLKDIKKLSPAEQTSGMESFHNIVCYFAPKSTHFFYWQMRARLFLSVLHFHENTSRVRQLQQKEDLNLVYTIQKEGKVMQLLRRLKSNKLSVMLMN